MKNKEDLIMEAGRLIADFRNYHDEGFNVCMRNSEMYISPFSKFKGSPKIIATFTRDCLRKGLTSKEWSELGDKLFTAYVRTIR